MAKPLVGILMGSDSDLPVMKEAADVLKGFGIPFEVTISSAHRSPKRTSEYAKSAASRGGMVISGGAGVAAHLSGVIAASTAVPVIGVPIGSSSLKGMDAILSTVQMPAGVPVATMAIGKAGAKNAGIFAAQIIAVGNKSLQANIKAFKEKLASDVEEKAKKIQL